MATIMQPFSPHPIDYEGLSLKSLSPHCPVALPLRIPAGRLTRTASASRCTWPAPGRRWFDAALFDIKWSPSALGARDWSATLSRLCISQWSLSPPRGSPAWCWGSPSLVTELNSSYQLAFFLTNKDHWDQGSLVCHPNQIKHFLQKPNSAVF